MDTDGPLPGENDAQWYARDSRGYVRWLHQQDPPPPFPAETARVIQTVMGTATAPGRAA